MYEYFTVCGNNCIKLLTPLIKINSHICSRKKIIIIRVNIVTLCTSHDSSFYVLTFK